MEPRQSGWRWGFAIGVFIAMSLVVGYVWYLLTVTAPRFETVYKDFGTKLPASTQILLDVSRWVRTPAGCLLFLLPIIPAVLIPRMGARAIVENDVAALVRQHQWVTLFLLMIISLMAVQMIIGAALADPMNAMIQNISSPHGR